MQSKLSKLWEKVIASIIVVMLTAGNLIVIGNGMVAYGLGNLETQDEKTAHENVEFGAYFISEGQQVHSLVSDVEGQAKLYMHLNVKNSGYLKSANIEMQEANYEVVGELEDSSVIASKTENGFKLRQINYGTEAVLEIPIAMEQKENFEIANVSKNSKVVLKGTYVANDGKENEIKKEVELNITWEGTSKVELTSETITYVSLEEETILQEKIDIEKIKASLPIRETVVEIQAPSLDGNYPKTVRVNSNKTEMTNGKNYEEVSIDYVYDNTTGAITIQVENKAENGIVYSGESGKDEFIVTYEYEGVQEGESEIQRSAKVTVENYGSGKNNKTETEATKKDRLSREFGELIGGEVAIEEINKAKIYANYNSNKREYETEYKITEIVNIFKSDAVKEITIENKEEAFANSRDEQYSTRIGDVDYTYYKETKIAVENFKKILGEDGYITIESEDGETIAKIDSSCRVIEGNYVLNYTKKYGRIIIKTSNPIAEGNLILEHKKAIKADLGYNKEETESFIKIIEKVLLSDSSTETEQLIEGEQKLSEAINYLKVESNKEFVNQKEEEIELKVEFGNNSENSILYSEPVVMVTLPDFVENVEVLNTNLLFEDELKIEKTEIETVDGKKAVTVKFDGAQTQFSSLVNGNGATLVLGAKLTNKEGAGDGKIIASVENNTAETSLISYLKAEESDIPPAIAIVGASENGEENSDRPEKQENPQIGIIMSSAWENYDLPEDYSIIYNIYVYSLEDEYGNRPEDIKNIVVKDFLPSGVTYESANYSATGNETQIDITHDEINRCVTWNIAEFPEDGEVRLSITVRANALSSGEYKKEISNTAIVAYDGSNGTISSNTIKTNIVKGHISVTRQTENIQTVNQMGDTIKFFLNSKNVGEQETDIKITASLPEEIEPKELGYGLENNIQYKSQNENEIDLEPRKLGAGETYRFALSATIKQFQIASTEKTKTVVVRATINGQETTWDVVIENPNYKGNIDNSIEQVDYSMKDKNNEQENIENSTTPNEQTTPNNPSDSNEQTTPNSPSDSNEQATPNNPSDSNESQEKTYTISGTAWLDENRNGVKEEGEKLLENIEVKLVKGKNIVKQTTTNNKGDYVFDNIAEGEYQIIFLYDQNTYMVTEYRKTGTLEINSSAIKGEDGQALTDVISVKGNVLNMNLGLTKIPEFDLSLTKQVSKIIIQNGEGTKTYEYKTDYAKTDINAKYLSGTVVLVEYKIIIKNEGELAGRVKKIVDYMPRDMIFSTDLNRTWVQDSNGNLTNSDLKDIDIEPGETKEVTLVLRKNMTDDNVGLINNTAEIAEAENSQNIKDKDSLPGNKVNEEDDFSSANVLLGIRTGSEVIYATLVAVILIILATGAFIIKRKVLIGIK